MDADYTSAKEYLRGEHYYGRTVRKFFLFGGVLMLVSLPFFYNLVPVNLLVSLLAVVVLGLFAGLLNPLTRWVVVLNVFVSLGAVIVFEYEAVRFYGENSSTTAQLFFVVNQILSLNFFFATYYGAKSARSLFVKEKFVNPVNPEWQYFPAILKM